MNLVAKGIMEGLNNESNKYFVYFNSKRIKIQVLIIMNIYKLSISAIVPANDVNSEKWTQSP